MFKTMDTTLGYWSINVALFVSHVGLWTAWTILIRYSRTAAAYDYDFQTVILLTECTKLVLAGIAHYWFIPSSHYVTEAKHIISQWRIGIHFAIPAFIYALYNTLFFLNLTFFDPVTYRVLINARIIFSGLLFQFFFSRRLGPIKWVALVLLAVGCAVNQLTSDFKLQAELLHLFAIMFQGFASSLGGVYSEYLLKRNVDLSLNIKNMYLYVFSILFNGGFLLLFKPHLFFDGLFFTGYTATTYWIILLGAVCGFSTALFLRYLNVLLKEYAHSGEMFATALVSWMFLDVDIGGKMLLSIALVTLSVYLYNSADKLLPARGGSSSAATAVSSGQQMLPVHTTNIKP